MKRHSNYVTAADTMDIEGLIRHLDSTGANSIASSPDFDVFNYANDNPIPSGPRTAA